MIYLKTDEEIELMRESNLLVGMTLGEMAKWIAPGITTLKLDKNLSGIMVLSRDFWVMEAFPIRSASR